MGRLRPEVLVLASGSPQRLRLLRGVRRRFVVEPSGVSETTRLKNPRAIVLELSLRKALRVARRRPEAAVLGSDTIVVCKGKILGKPRDRNHALRILRLLNGAWQDVYTGVAVVTHGGKKYWRAAVRSRVKARCLSERELKRLSKKHHDKAGAYAVQDRDDPFIERIAGEKDNVIGLPRKAVRALLRKAGA